MTTLRPVELEILLTLAAGPRHGYAIIQETEARTPGAGRLETATLYRALKRLVDGGLVRPTADPGSADDPTGRRRCYAVTAAGKTAAREEVARLEQLVRWARSTPLIPGR
jgi:DNA-binding PadR family transcriptional regulator